MAEAAEFFARHAGMAYGLALGVTGEPAAAEDVVQEAFMRLIRQGTDLEAAGAREYLAGAVLNTARNWWREEARRKARERAAASATATPAGEAALPGEERRAVRAALAALDEDRRLPVQLHVVEEFSQREVARVLGLPVSTVSQRINAGLEQMRGALTRAGLSALAGPALLAALQAGCRIEAPAALVGRLNELAAAAKLTAASTALKGGLIVKIGLGVAAAGLVAGTTFWAVGSRSEEPARVEKPASKFATPATDPGAEWEDKGLWAGGVGVYGYLDGPRHEAMFYSCPSPSGLFQEQGYANVFRAYDPKTDRFMTVIGCGSEGTIDGPFSRVRLGGWGYSSSGGMASGGSSRYKYMSTREGNKDILRRLDLKKRVLERAAANVDVTGCQICMFEGGFFLLRGNNLRKVSDDGKVLAEYTLDKAPRESLGPYDPKNDRLYGSSREGKEDWVAWGWDLKAGGKFFGLLPAMRTPENQPLRKQCATGPFKGSFFYCPGGLGFGPGDPEYRYLYMGGGDEANMYRLDLEKQEWIKLVRTADKKRWRFGEAPDGVQAWDAGGGIPWANDGTDNMYPGYHGWCRMYERVK